MQRRKFIRRAAIGVITITGVAAAGSYLRQFFPRLTGERRRIAIGDSMQYPVDTFTYLKEHNLFVYRDHEGIRAVSAVCTHLGCILEKTTDGFECPCHGSCYNQKGEVVSGPAPRNLSWYLVQMAADGKIIVDPGRTVSADDKYLTS